MVTTPQQLLDPRQGARHDLDVRLGPRRRHQALRGGRAARPEPARASRCGSCSRASRSPSTATARTWSSPARVSSKYVVDKAAEVAAGYVEKKENVVNLLRQQEGVGHQPGAAARAVRRSEPQRDARSSARASSPQRLQAATGSAGRRRSSSPRRSSTARRAALVFSDFLNLFLFDTKEQLGAVVKALQNKGLFQSLAEPNLIAENGKEASFLAGGEYPYPVVQGSGGTNRHDRVQGVRRPAELHADRRSAAT